MAEKYYEDIFNLLNASRPAAAPVQDAGLLFGPSQIASNLARYQAVPLGAQYMPDAQVNGLSPYQQIMARMAAMQRAPRRLGDGTGGFRNVPLGIGGDIGGGSPVITDPTYGIPIFNNPITEPIIPEDDNPPITPEEAIKRIEDEVAQEEYDQENQDAIDRIEQAVEEEQDQQRIKDLEDTLKEEALAESARASDIDDATISTDPVYIADDGTTESIEDTIREIAPVEPTPEGLLSTDEFGDLDQAIELERYAQETQDAISKYEQEIRDEAVSQTLAQENPYGNLDEAIAANLLSDSARASAIDDATISTSNNNTYSGFDPTSANPTIPVEDRIPSPVDEPVRSLLDIGVDPETGVAEDNGAAESIIRDQEALIRDEVRRMSEMMGSNYSDFSYVQPEASYVQPEAQPYVAPYVEPYVEPYMAPYIQPEAQPYVEPYMAPYIQPEAQPYVEPYMAPYVEPYVQPEAPYVEPYVAPYVEPYVQPEINQFAGLLSPEIAPESPVFANNPYVNPIEAIQAEGLLSPYSEMTSGGGGGGGGYAGNLANQFGDFENTDFAANYLLY
jgi:hypothetical protein